MSLLIEKWFDEDLDEALSIYGTGAFTQDDQTIAATGDVDVAGTASITQDNQTLAATGDVDIVATGAYTQADQTLAAEADVIVTATGAFTQDAQTLAAEADAIITATGAVTQDDQTSSADTDVVITGTGAFTQEDQTLAATGEVIHSAESILYLDDSNDDSGPRPRTSIVPETPLNIPVPPPEPVQLPLPLAAKPKRKKKDKEVDSPLRHGIVEVPGVVSELRVTPPVVARAKRRVAIDKPAVPPAAAPAKPPDPIIVPDWRDEVDVEALASFLAARDAKFRREATAAAVAAFIKEFA